MSAHAPLRTIRRSGRTSARVLTLAVLMALPGPTALADPQETVTFLNVPSNGVLNSPANALRDFSFAGGYTLGRIDLSGTLTREHVNTVPFDARILVTPPSAAPFVLQVFTSGATFTTLPFNYALYVPNLTTAAGNWSLRFFEVIDNGGVAEIDATWDLTITTTDEPALPPAAVQIGAVLAPGVTPTPLSLGSAQVRWYRFDLQCEVSAARGTWLDVDLSESTLTGQFPQHDTSIALYDSAGARVAEDNDSGPSFQAQLSFGAGTRPPILDGDPFDGSDGPLAAGTYYLAVAADPLLAGGYFWQATSTATMSGIVRPALNTNLVTPCPPLLCRPDLTTGAIPGQPGYGVPNGVLNNDDFFYYLSQFAAGNVAVCDMTTGAIPGQPGYGVPNGILNNDDFFYYLSAFAAGC